MGLTNFPNGVNAGDSAVDGGTPLQIRSVTVSATAAELNTLAGALGAKALSYDSATPMVMASGSTAVTGTALFGTGLGGTVSHVLASIAHAGTSVSSPRLVQAYGLTSGGTITIECYALAGTLTNVAGTVNWIAIGTAAS